MTLEGIKKEFKKHWHYAMKLKEGGKAWEREMKLCDKYLKAGRAKLKTKYQLRYGQ